MKAIMVCLMVLGCSSPAAPEHIVEIGGSLDHKGYGLAGFPVGFGNRDDFPSISCYIAPDEFSNSWVLIAASSIAGFCSVEWHRGQKHWDVEVFNSVPGWWFKAVGVS